MSCSARNSSEMAKTVLRWLEEVLKWPKEVLEIDLYMKYRLDLIFFLQIWCMSRSHYVLVVNVAVTHPGLYASSLSKPE